VYSSWAGEEAKGQFLFWGWYTGFRDFRDFRSVFRDFSVLKSGYMDFGPDFRDFRWALTGFWPHSRYFTSDFRVF